MTDSDQRDRPGQKRRDPMGGGAPLALLIIAGVVIGGIVGQPSLGLLAGLALGVIVATVIWWTGRNR